MLELRDVHTYYGESHVLRGLSLSIGRGEIVALLGRNGAGKTTTVRSACGLSPPRSGSVLLDGADVTGAPAYRIARAGVGLVPQGRRIFPSLSVRENLTVGARRGAAGEDAWSLNRVYETFPALAERAAVKGARLSGGEQQLLAIARALMTNPKLLLMDEPSEGLAPLAIESIAATIEVLGRGEISILLVEQNLPLALRAADRVYVMSKGRVVHEASPAALAADEAAQARYLGVAAELEVSGRFVSD